MRHEFLRRASLPLAVLRGAVSAMRTAESVRFDVMTRVRALTEAMGGSLRMPSETPFNREIGPHRRFEWLTMDLADIKKLRKSGFRARMSTPGGRKVLSARRAKGRARLSA
mgnify:CR=1 FL=1